MSLKQILIKNEYTYKIYLYYNLFIRHKGFLKRKQYSQWGEDIYINNYFENLKAGTYLDIGCFHPFMYSNTCLLFNKGWSGVNIDINQTSIDLFNIVRPKDTNICTTVSEEKKVFKVFFDDFFSPVNTLDENFFKSLNKSFFKKKQVFTIKSKTISEILNTGKGKDKIDFLNIDAEGLDFKILQQINLKKYHVRLVSIETHNVNGTKLENCDLIIKLLKKNNFSVYKRAGPTTLFSINQ